MRKCIVLASALIFAQLSFANTLTDVKAFSAHELSATAQAVTVDVVVQNSAIENLIAPEANLDQSESSSKVRACTVPTHSRADTAAADFASEVPKLQANEV